MKFPYHLNSTSGENPCSILHRGGLDRFHFACKFCISQSWLLELLYWEDVETSQPGQREEKISVITTLVIERENISDQLVMSALAEGEAEMVWVAKTVLSDKNFVFLFLLV